MTIAELIETLQNMVEAGVPEDTDVRLAMQPSYPFEYTIGRVELVDLADVPDGEDEEAQPEKNEQVVYIGEGRQTQYLPGAVSEAFGWR